MNMKMKRFKSRLLPIYYLGLIICILSVGMTRVSGGQEPDHENFLVQAERLKEIGLFQGTGKGFELDRLAKRVEAGVIIVRILGKEDIALSMNYSHPFTDVPSWADAYIGYLYHEGLTKGLGGGLYGSNDYVTPDVFTTLCLRALGYLDGLDGYTWDASLKKAEELGALDEYYGSYLMGQTWIYRDDIVGILYNLLNTKMNKIEGNLIDFLIDNQVTSLEKALSLGLYQKSVTLSLDLTIQEIVLDYTMILVNNEDTFKTVMNIDFNSDQTIYPSIYKGYDDNGNFYQVYIPRTLYYEQVEELGLGVGDSLNFQGQTLMHLMKDDGETIYVLMVN